MNHPQQAGGVIMKSYFRISNFALCKEEIFPIGALSSNEYLIMFRCAKAYVFIGFLITISKPQINFV